MRTGQQVRIAPPEAGRMLVVVVTTDGETRRFDVPDDCQLIARRPDRGGSGPESRRERHLRACP